MALPGRLPRTSPPQRQNNQPALIARRAATRNGGFSQEGEQREKPPRAAAWAATGAEVLSARPRVRGRPARAAVRLPGTGRR